MAKSSKLAKKSYRPASDLTNFNNNISLGVNTSYIYSKDPKYLGFLISRHKFIGKLILNFRNVFEIGCAEGFSSSIISQFVKKIYAIDNFPKHIEEAKKTTAKHFKNITFKEHDIIDAPILKEFDAAYTMDVLEHIDRKQENIFMKNIVKSLSKNGILILGTPSLYSQKFTSKENRKSHINCKTDIELKKLCFKYFKNVFLFSSNDEIVHTGFEKMSNYYIALCCNKK